MRVALMAALVVLGGCAGGARLMPRGVSGNETFVTVSNVWNSADALPTADAHCHGYGKAARFSHMEGYNAIFDCVRPD